MSKAIDEKLVYLDETKELIKQALIAKGAVINDEDTFRSYVEKIETIKTGASEEWLAEVQSIVDGINGEEITDSVVMTVEEVEAMQSQITALETEIESAETQTDEILS